tara:strand:+ start:84969 stop:85916 length:948 start_codon:yes stop_codon:yes gene_type:complete
MNHWQFIHSKITAGKTVYLLTVIQHKGSSPGRQGFKMVVATDEIFGSIGGGVMEFNLVEQCKKLLQQGACKPFIKHQIHKGKIVDGSGMICSGEQTVIFYPLDKSNSPFINTILNTLQENSNGLLSIKPNSIEFYPEKQQETRYHYTHMSESNWSYQEQLNQKDILYIVGGGHVGLATTKLFSTLGFYTVVFDNRSQLNTFEANSYADKKHIVDYTAIANYIPENTSTYVAIMTNKYTDDKIVLSQLIAKKYRFIGVLGSVAKLELMFEVLQKEGVTTDQLANVHAPIGIKIHSQTPEEIAVSIAAQIIAIKNKK